MAARYEGPAERLVLYERLVATNPDVERKGATMPYTSRNGHMFSFLDPTGTMALRLSDDDRSRFIEEYQTALAEQYGRVMKEYVVVPDDLFGRTEELGDWFRRSHEWISTLEPKATTR
jgi:hypothetical protein